jgi:hypothetical protein
MYMGRDDHKKDEPQKEFREFYKKYAETHIPVRTPERYMLVNSLHLKGATNSGALVAPAKKGGKKGFWFMVRADNTVVSIAYQHCFLMTSEERDKHNLAVMKQMVDIVWDKLFEKDMILI